MGEGADEAEAVRGARVEEGGRAVEEVAQKVEATRRMPRALGGEAGNVVVEAEVKEASERPVEVWGAARQK